MALLLNRVADKFVIESKLGPHELISRGESDSSAGKSELYEQKVTWTKQNSVVCSAKFWSFMFLLVQFRLFRAHLIRPLKSIDAIQGLPIILSKISKATGLKINRPSSTRKVNVQPLHGSRKIDGNHQRFRKSSFPSLWFRYSEKCQTSANRCCTMWRSSAKTRVDSNWVECTKCECTFILIYSLTRETLNHLN